jgi:toxin ParE1/3/4
MRRIMAMPYAYLVFYEATETEVVIHSVRHAARDPTGTPGSACQRAIRRVSCLSRIEKS